MPVFSSTFIYFCILEMTLWPLKWTVISPDCAPLPVMPQLRKLRTAASSALHAMKNTQVKMSHVLHCRDRDNCDGTRQLDSCTKHCGRAWFRMTFGEAGVHGKTQMTKTVDLRTLRDLWSRADKSTWGINMSTQVSESLFRGLNPQLNHSMPQQNSRAEASFLSSGLTVRLKSQLENQLKLSHLMEMLWLESKSCFHTWKFSKEATQKPHQMWSESVTAGKPLNIRSNHFMHLEHPD